MLFRMVYRVYKGCKSWWSSKSIGESCIDDSDRNTAALLF
jgi:hypothetical protein